MRFICVFVKFMIYLASSCGYIGIFLLNMLEYACLPFPSDIVLPAIGASVSSGKYNMIYVLPLSIIGGVVGALISYTIGMREGRKVISLIERKHKKSRFIFEKIEKLFLKYGKVTVFLARLLPFTRTYISLFAGAEKVNRGMFIICSALGIAITDTFYLLLGYFAYDNKSLIEKLIRQYSVALISILVIAILSYYVYKKIKLRGINKELKFY